MVRVREWATVKLYRRREGGITKEHVSHANVLRICGESNRTIAECQFGEWHDQIYIFLKITWAAVENDWGEERREIKGNQVRG